MITEKIAQVCYRIPTSFIVPDPDQPRKEFDPVKLQELAGSIAAEGLLQPITVRLVPGEARRYIIVTGERRWRAHALAGIQAVNAYISTKHEDDAKRLRTQVLENYNRVNPTLHEDANAVERLHQLGDSDEVIGKAIGLTKHRVGALRKLTSLSPSLWKLIDGGSIQPSIAEAAVTMIPADHVEAVLLRCAGKTRNVAAAFLDNFVHELNQDKFDLVMVEAGVSGSKDRLAGDLTRQLMEVAALIEKLSHADAQALARVVGNKVAATLNGTPSNQSASLFLSRVFTHTSAMMKSKE